MKLISLNVWGGKMFEPLMDFIKLQSKDTDIFCFQEILTTTSDKTVVNNYRVNLLDELKSVLPNFDCYFISLSKTFDSEGSDVDFDLEQGHAIFAKKGIKVGKHQDKLLLGKKFAKHYNADYSDFPIDVQYIEISSNNKKYTINNFHGRSYPGSKLDTPDRLQQSKKLAEVIKNQTGARILIGDFNLMPETQSIALLEEGMVNLIKKFNIQETRGSLNPYLEHPDWQHFADFAFVSTDISVKSFALPDARVSDHMPMILEFE